MMFGGRPVCNTSTMRCAECLTNGDCTGRGGGGRVCDPPTNHCVECLTNADCPTGMTCSTTQMCL
jgi:Cys-rich repeat protein